MNIFKKLIKTKDFFAIMCFYILSLYIYTAAKEFPVIPGAPKAQNPGFYPKLLSGLLIFLSTLYLFQVIYKIKMEISDSDGDIENFEGGFLEQSNRKTKIFLLISILMLGIFKYFLEWLGFATASFVFLVIMSKMLSPENTKFSKILVFSVIVTVIMFVVFDIFVRIRFPEGLLF